MVRIVVWDPTGRWPEGTLLEGSSLLHVEKSRGAVLLPADADLCLGQDAVAGYFRRGWGMGVAWTDRPAQRACSMLLRIVPERPWLHWCARVVPMHADGPPPRGRLHLVTNTGQMGGTAVRVSPMSEPQSLEDSPIDEHGGWTLKGTSQLGMAGEGMLGLALYGAATGCAVLWSAATQTRNPE